MAASCISHWCRPWRHSRHSGRLLRETKKPGGRGGSPESTPPLGAANDVVPVEDVEVVMVRDVVSEHLRVHEVVLTVSGLFVQRLGWSANKRSHNGSIHKAVHRSHMQTHLVLCGSREFANQRVVNGYSVVQTPL